MKIIIFDIDGTLLLAGGIGRIAFNRIFQEMFQIDNVWGNYDPHGKTDCLIIHDLAQSALGRKLEDSEKTEVTKRYIQYFNDMFEQVVHFKLLLGVEKLLSMLSQEKYHLGIATGNYKETAIRKLKRGKIDHFFSFGGYGSDSHDRLQMTEKALERGLQSFGKPIEKKNIFLVGDAQADMACAKALGLHAIGVATGSLSVEQLKMLNPDFLLPNLENAEQFLAYVSKN